MAGDGAALFVELCDGVRFWAPGQRHHGSRLTGMVERRAGAANDDFRRGLRPGRWRGRNGRAHPFDRSDLEKPPLLWVGRNACCYPTWQTRAALRQDHTHAIATELRAARILKIHT